MLYGYDPPVVAAPMVHSVDNKSVQDMLADRGLHTALVKRHLAAAQNRVKL
jgi:hypothetical protein